MKSSTSLVKTQMPHDAVFVAEIKRACLDATSTAGSAVKKALYAGQLLIEWKGSLPHGQFLPAVKNSGLGISEDTAQRWMNAAANALKALPLPSIEIEAEKLSVSTILSSDDNKLPRPLQEWKRERDEQTGGRNIKHFLFCRSERSNGAKPEGSNGAKSSNGETTSLSAGRHLAALSKVWGKWEKIPGLQRKAIVELVADSILGKGKVLVVGHEKRVFVFNAPPKEVCCAAIDALQERLERPAESRPIAKCK